MNSTLIERRHTPNETRAVDALVMAFKADPAARWTYPDPPQYLAHFPEFVRALGGQAFERSTADYLDDFSGVALWLPPNAYPDEAAIVDVLQRTVSEERLPEVSAVLEQMGKFHPAEPHWYLPLIGVVPGRQGRGFGSALLRRGLARCDRDGLPAYLEATSLLSVGLYEDFGFEAVGRIKTRTSPPIIPMIRPAK